MYNTDVTEFLDYSLRVKIFKVIYNQRHLLFSRIFKHESLPNLIKITHSLRAIVVSLNFLNSSICVKTFDMICLNASSFLSHFQVWILTKPLLSNPADIPSNIPSLCIFEKSWFDFSAHSKFSYDFYNISANYFYTTLSSCVFDFQAGILTKSLKRKLYLAEILKFLHFFIDLLQCT